MTSYNCRCTPTLKCCPEGIANSSLPEYERELMTDTATRRFEQALWYAYGQIDANHSNGTPLVINATAFAEYARAQATEEDTYLPSIMEQWEAYST